MKTNTVFSLIVAASLVLSGTAFAAGGKYQAKGKVTKVSKTTFVVDNGKQKMEFTRDANTKVKGDLKEGAEVTVNDTMHATSVDSKAAAAPAASPAAKASPAKPAKPLKAQKKEEPQ
jgi:hypothetical protein